MKVWQATQHLVYLLSAPSVANGKTTGLVWPTGLGQAVFGKVAVSADPPEFNELDAAEPFVLIAPQAKKGLVEHPADLTEEARWSLKIFALNANDQSGQAPIVGATRLSGAGSSVGRGLLEIEPLVEAALFAAATFGTRLRVEAGPVISKATRANGVLAARVLTVTAAPRLPSQPCFDPVSRLLATGAAGVVTLSWSIPDRWDLVGVRVCRASGSTPPASPTTGVVATTALVMGYVDSPGVGTWSYSVFAAFDSTRNPLDGARDASNPVTDFSGSGTAQGGFAYRAATVTVTA